MKFRATILLKGKTATGVEVPDDIVESLGQGKHPKVSVTIKGHTYRSSVASMGGVFMLGIGAEIREQTGVAAGDEIEVHIEPDTAPREVEVPADFTEALRHHKKAQEAFDKMSYSHKRQHVLAIEGARTQETRQRRIDKAIAMLEEGTKGK